MYVFKGENPTKMYYNALSFLMSDGDECQPRGKLIKELRPAVFEFKNPYNRVTFLGGRRINSFFQLAESLWILSGRSDVEWLTQFNANMKQFSDDGVNFNAPYGERIRSWGKNAAHNIIINPVDQLLDVYCKFMHDKDTRQAMIVISNPSFDNSTYTIGESGKDIACNLVLTFKIRDDKLHLTVFNRSNDLHWGTFGANLCQFSTIQEVLCSWLRNSDNDKFSNLELGTYNQITDSLHIYLDTYGSKCTSDVKEYYKSHSLEELDADFTCKNEPRMSLSAQEFDVFLQTYWDYLDSYMSDDEFLSDENNVRTFVSMIGDLHESGTIDDYWYFAILAMLSYRLFKLNKTYQAVKILTDLPNCQLKVSLMYFAKGLKNIYKVGDESPEEYLDLQYYWNLAIDDLKASLICDDWCKLYRLSELLQNYLEL